jgi:hypothetical protein
VTSISPIELPDGRLATLSASNVVVSADSGATWQPASTRLPYGDSSGFIYSAHQKAFFIKHFDCGKTVLPDALMRFDFDYER